MSKRKPETQQDQPSKPKQTIEEWWSDVVDAAIKYYGNAYQVIEPVDALDSEHVALRPIPVSLVVGTGDDVNCEWWERAETEDELIEAVYSLLVSLLDEHGEHVLDHDWEHMRPVPAFGIALTVLERGPLTVPEVLALEGDDRNRCLRAAACTYVHYGAERAAAARERLRPQLIEMLELGLETSVQ